MSGRLLARAILVCQQAAGKDVDVTSGRKLIEEALRGPMADCGWRPRAAGWFTKELAPGRLGVIALGVASAHSAPGTATAAAHVHLRDSALEADVATLSGIADRGYRTATASTSVGYLMAAARWVEWPVDEANADQVADEIAAAVRTYAEPYLRGLAEDDKRLLAAVRSSPTYRTALGLARAVALLRRMDERAEAAELLSERAAALGDRSDRAAADERQLAASLNGWLAR